MNKETYNIIISELDKRIDTCKIFDNAKAGKDISNSTVAEIRHLRDVAKKELPEMTNMAMIDLYHIIGMGDLTVVQLSEFIKKIREYLSYRAALKAFAQYEGSIDDLPQVPECTKYRMKVLGDFYLIHGKKKVGKAISEDEVDIEEYWNEGRLNKLKSNPVNFELADKQITISLEQLDNFHVCAPCFGCGSTSDLETLRRRATTGKDYCGISWKGLDANGNVWGVVKSNIILDKLNVYLSMKDRIDGKERKKNAVG